MKNVTILALAVVVLAGLGGCSRPERAAVTEPLCLAQMDVDRAMLSARTVLEQMHFSIEKYDPDVRFIRTRPLSGAQFFELWRQDNASASTAARANLQSLRRIVEIEATPYANRTCLSCRVTVQQLSLPETPIMGTRRLAGIYTDNSSTTYQTLLLDEDQLEQMEWLDAGEDRALEQKIIDKIREKATL